MKILNNFALFALLLALLVLPFSSIGIINVSNSPEEVLPASTVYQNPTPTQSVDIPENAQSTMSVEPMNLE